jgi:dsRNA-specific ribonuclease
MQVTMNGRVLGTGSGRSKARAEQAAAEDALTKGEY